jgi:hypothetical protein
MVKYKCEKHGILSGSERIVWNQGAPGRWCLHCVNEMMDKFCGKLIKVEDENGDDSQKTDI